MSDSRVAIVGAGITGLTTAHHLEKSSAHRPVVFEADDRPGGPIRSDALEGYLLESGPHTILQRNASTAELIDELGLRDSVVETDDEANLRYVVRDGVPLPVPMSPVEFLTSDLLSTGAKLRLLGEPFVPPRRDDVDESLANFVRRRLGEEVLEYAVGPMVGGVFAGRPRELSARRAFEDVWRLEREYGSLAAGMIARAFGESDGGGPPRKLLSFEGGAEELVEALVDELGDAIRCERRVVGATRTDDGWTIEFDDGPRATDFDELVWTAPAYELPDFELADAAGRADLARFEEVYYPPVTVVSTGIERSRIEHPLDGFGCLVPESEPYRILGTLFMSSLFPGRAPPGRVLLSSFVGGSRNPELTSHSREEIVSFVERDLRELLGLRGSPKFVRLVEWERAIPQYEVGYGRVLERFRQLEARFDGLRFTGAFRDGIAVPDLVEAARETADAIRNGGTP